MTMLTEDKTEKIEKGDSEELDCIWDHNYSFCGENIVIREDYDAGLGGTLFDGALCLCNYIETLFNKDRTTLQDKTVIELGAGCGLPGILMYKLQNNVYLTDIEQTVELLQENVESNETLDNNFKLIVDELDWKKPEQLLKFKHINFDYILAADTVYSIDCVDPFLQVLEALSGKDTKVLFAHPAPRVIEASNLFWSKLVKSFNIKKVHPQEFVPNYSEQLKKGKKMFESETKGVFILRKKL